MSAALVGRIDGRPPERADSAQTEGGPMTAQPVHHHPDPVPRNATGIAAALDGERRTEFYREFLAAAPEQAEGVLRRWWCEATLDASPDGERLTTAALDGTLPVTTVADLVRQRVQAGLPVE